LIYKGFGKFPRYKVAAYHVGSIAKYVGFVWKAFKKRIKIQVSIDKKAELIFL
jgi:hypothetical protein